MHGLSPSETLAAYHDAMSRVFSPSGWWPHALPPRDEPARIFEVMVGAVLTQNTAWKNVEKALASLRGAKALSPQAIEALEVETLQERIRSSGYFRQKAARLKTLCAYLREACDYDLESLRQRDMNELRGELLALSGIGPETADSILCYALGFPTFVVDAYTVRILARHGLLPEEPSGPIYEEIRELGMAAFPPDAELLGEAHALYVRTGARYCAKRSPSCLSCPLAEYLPEGGALGV